MSARSHSHRRARRRPHGRSRILISGEAPGTLTVDPLSPQTQLHVMAFTDSDLLERDITSVDELKAIREKFPLVWVDVTGLGSQNTLHALGETFHLHPLALEDVVNGGQRSKAESYGNHLFVVLYHLNMKDGPEPEQVSLFLGKDFVVTFQSRSSRCFVPVQERIRNRVGRIHRSGPDYLAYSLLDAVIDQYFPLCDTLDARAEALEASILDQTQVGFTQELMNFRHDILTIRRYVRPMDETFDALLSDELPWISLETRVFLRDCQDHASRVLETLESYRELSMSLVDVHLGVINQKVNDVMRVLTIFATLFMPLSFIAGVYGMNFSHEASALNMPELSWRYGYFFALGLMAAVTIGLLIYFWRKGWLGSNR